MNTMKSKTRRKPPLLSRNLQGINKIKKTSLTNKTDRIRDVVVSVHM